MLVDTRVIHVNSDNDAWGRSESCEGEEESLKKSSTNRGGEEGEGDIASVRSLEKKRSNKLKVGHRNQKDVENRS